MRALFISNPFKMPLLTSNYIPPFLLTNGHVQTLFAAFGRRPNGITYVRERIPTPDHDFLDLDGSKVGSKNMAIVSHGLGGDSGRPYILGMVKALNQNGWDAVAWNFRGFSGEPNRTLKMTHSGATEDLHTVVSHVKANRRYRRIALIGFSLGGNLTLKYLGERGRKIDPRIQSAVALSVPCHLESSAGQLAKLSNRIYMLGFLFLLRNYVRSKKGRFPHEMNDAGFHRIQNFKDFDGRYVAPIHGFKNAQDYWRKSSSLPFLEKIRIPTLLINARNDPFLTQQGFPISLAKKNQSIILEKPE
jgi:predicted alpha/beta-fold hydrolase